MMNKELRGRLWYDGDEVDPVSFVVGMAEDWSKLVGYCSDCGAKLVGCEAAPYPDVYEDSLAERLGKKAVPIVQCINCGMKSARKLEKMEASRRE